MIYTFESCQSQNLILRRSKMASKRLSIGLKLIMTQLELDCIVSEC